MSRSGFLVLLAAACIAAPLSAQTAGTLPPPAADEEETRPQDLPPAVCPSDHRDGPLYGGEVAYYGVPARRIVETWLAGPGSSYSRVQSGTENVTASSLRVLTDATDYDTCLRLTTILTGGERSAPPFRTWVYFTAGGFYFVSQWKPAQTLDNYTTSYAHVIVFDSTFAVRGTYAF